MNKNNKVNGTFSLDGLRRAFEEGWNRGYDRGRDEADPPMGPPGLIGPKNSEEAWDEALEEILIMREQRLSRG